jgi:HSP20 family protein
MIGARNIGFGVAGPPAPDGPAEPAGRPAPVRAPWRHPIPADVVVDRGYIIVTADLPGYPSENVEVVVMPRCVEIIGWPPESPAAGRFLVSERRHEVVRRTLRMPEEIVPARSVARLSGGVLEVKIPRLPLESGWPGRIKGA